MVSLGWFFWAKPNDSSSDANHPVFYSPLIAIICFKLIDIKKGRHFKVLVNPFGGQGHAKKLWETIAEPIFKAAGCTYDLTCMFLFTGCA